jgi:hypothetical protein
MCCIVYKCYEKFCNKRLWIAPESKYFEGFEHNQCWVGLPLTMNRDTDDGHNSDPRACFVAPCYKRPKYRFRACCAVLPCCCCPATHEVMSSQIRNSWAHTGAYFCVCGLEDPVGTSLTCGKCLPCVCGCFPCNKKCRDCPVIGSCCCKSTPCCLHANYAQDSIDQYLAIQLAK